MDEELESKSYPKTQTEDETTPCRKLLQVPILTLQVIGLWAPENISKNRTKKILYTCYSVGVVSYVSMLVTSAAINLKYSTGDMIEFNESLLAIITFMNTSSKVFTLLLRRDRVISAMSTLDELVLTWGLVAHSQPSKEERDSALQVWQRRYKYITIFSLLNMLCIFFAWIVFPIVLSSDSERKLPIASWFPFDTRPGQQGYWVAFAFQCTSAFFDGYFALTPDCFFVGLLLFCLLCLRALQPALNDITAEGSNVECSNEKDVLHRHQLVLRCIQELSDVIGPFMFVHSLGMSLILCTTVMNTSMVGLNIKGLAVGAFAVMEMIELFVFCWFGSEIQTQSVRCGTNIYCSEWYDAQPSVKTSIRIAIMRAQKPAVIRGFGYTTLTLQLFTSLIRLSYSFYTLLRQMAD